MASSYKENMLAKFRNVIDQRTRSASIVNIHLELANYCNLQCRWCALDHSQAKQRMEERLLRKLLENLLSDSRFEQVRGLMLWNGGEALLHPDFVNMLAVMKEFKARFLDQGRSFPRVVLTTNGIALKQRLAREIISVGVLDEIRFSVDGGSREKYEELRGGARWEIISKNIEEFVKLNDGAIATKIFCIIEPGKELSRDWMSDEFTALLELVDEFGYNHPHNWLGDVEVEGYDEEPVSSCFFLQRILVVLPDGGVTVCCADLNGRGVVGNLYEENLYQIYSSAKRREMLRLWGEGKRDRVELCRDCTGWSS
jgi:sulfatase maturation enzyme AslB (radical SAM superfamily)